MRYFINTSIYGIDYRPTIFKIFRNFERKENYIFTIPLNLTILMNIDGNSKYKKICNPVKITHLFWFDRFKFMLLFNLNPMSTETYDFLVFFVYSS
jgi:hypothetical protein